MDSLLGVIAVVVGIAIVVVAAVVARLVVVLLGEQRRCGADPARAAGVEDWTVGDGISDRLRLVIEEQQRIAQAQFHEALAEQQRLASQQLDTIVQQLVVTNRTQLEGARAQTTEELEGKKSMIDRQLGAMTDELTKVTELVRQFETERDRKLGQLASQLNLTNEGIAALGQSTQSLREALSSTKARGQWGERMAEDVLRLAGFVENVNYRRQRSPEGTRGIPDFTFFLPNDLMLHMDVKFPLDNYLRFLESESDTDQKRYSDGFLRDVRARVKELAGREYIDPGGATVDFVLLFIPNEQLYAFIHEHDGVILEDAVRQRVVFCSPLTLFAVLALIRQTVENFRLAKTSDEILGLLGQFSDQRTRFVEQMDKLGSRIESVGSDFESLRGTRRRQLEKPLRRIDELRRQDECQLTELTELPDSA